MDPEQLASARRLTAHEEPELAAVRSRAQQVTTPVPPEVGALLQLLAASSHVRHAVEFGAGGGVSAAWLVAGMGDKGVLTSIEGDTHLHGLATAAFAELGISDRVRTILGDAATVADRLGDDGYDLVLLQGSSDSQHALLPDTQRLLRPGGLLVARRVLPAGHGPSTLVEAVAGEPWADATVLPVDDGLLLARLEE